MQKKQIAIVIAAFSAAMTTNVFGSNRFESKAAYLRKKPNIIFIFTDQQNVKAISAHGNSNLMTPNIDYLVKNDVSFINSYCTSPVCGPSRSSLITGRMPHKTGVDYNNGATIKEGVNNLGEILSKYGYETVWAGKWHLPESYPQQKQIDSIKGFHLLKFYHPDSLGWELGSKTDKPLADAVLKFIKNYTSQKPLFLCISLHNPHDICYFPRKIDQYPNPCSSAILPPLPANHQIPLDEPELLSNSRKRDHYGDELLLSQKNDETKWRSYLWYYYRLTELVDAEIGRILKGLKEKGMDDNTLIVFSSDHGDGMGEKKWAAKLSLQDGPAKVPFILYFKNIIPATGIDNQHLVSGIDLVPTILDYANIEKQKGLMGLSLKKVIEAPNVNMRDFVVTELALDPFDKTLNGRMIRTNQFKYIIYSKGERREELYNMSDDPFEMKNIINSLQYQSTKIILKNLLKGWLKQTEDPFLTSLN